MAEELKEYIHKKRPSLSKSSLTTYASVLRSLYKRCFGEGKVVWDKFDDTKEVLGHLKDIPPNRRKTILSALVIVTDKKEYREQMLNDCRDYNAEINKQEKTDEQKEGWVEKDEVRTKFEEVKRNAMLIVKKAHLKPADLQEIQSYIILAVLSGIFIPPRRSKDFCDFKIKNVDENKDNFMTKKELVFNSYKTAKYYGTQKVECPPALMKILKDWIKINPTEYLLFDAKYQPLTPVKLNQRLNKIFGGRPVAVNSLRHSFLTDKYAEHSKVEKEINEDMSEMGSSARQLKTYVKLD
jgi:integrase